MSIKILRILGCKNSKVHPEIGTIRESLISEPSISEPSISEMSNKCNCSDIESVNTKPDPCVNIYAKNKEPGAFNQYHQRLNTI